MGDRTAHLRGIPAVDRLLAHSAWDEGGRHVAHSARRAACREVVGELRGAILAGEATVDEGTLDRLVGDAVARARADVAPVLRRVVNATGVVLHTNLGRAPLADAALAAIADAAGGYVNIEMDLDSGKRDNRMGKVAAGFQRVLGCGDVVVAGNNAAAVFLALSALCGDGQKVAISRGELVEIGGSFRMPDIMDASGAAMVEVGTTNRTWAKDYESALDAGAAVLLKVHRSNFDLVGFTKEVTVEELVGLARPREALVVHDLGSGLLRGDDSLGRDTVRRSLDAGVDLVLFSGDKLLGGPQCGIAAGRAEVVERLRSHPIMRMVRPGKLTLLALEATLLAWERDPEGSEIPAAVLAARTTEELRASAEALAEAIRAAGLDGLEVAVIDVDSTMGGGSSALIRLPSSAVALTPRGGVDDLAASLRRREPAVVGRIEADRLLLDVRTLLDGDAARVVAAFGRIGVGHT